MDAERKEGGLGTQRNHQFGRSCDLAKKWLKGHEEIAMMVGLVNVKEHFFCCFANVRIELLYLVCHISPALQGSQP